jgi:hypothetical protein
MAANAEPKLYARKLTDEQARTIRVMYARGYKSGYQLAAQYGVTQAAIQSVVQFSVYKTAGGPRTWPGENEPPSGYARGQCRDKAARCLKPIADSGWAQRMHLCERCYRLSGHKCGRERTGKVGPLTCCVCRNKFTKYRAPSKNPARVCSDECRRKHIAQTKLKRPAEMTSHRLYELYWGRNRTTREIATMLGTGLHPSTIRLWLIADGTPLRANQWRRYSHCAIEGCSEPIQKRWNGIRHYGRLCREHWNQRDATRAKIYQHEIHEERGKELLAAIATLLRGLPESVKADVESELVLAVLAGDFALPLTPESIKPYIASAFREYADGFGTISIDTPAPGAEDDRYTWAEKLKL